MSRFESNRYTIPSHGEPQSLKVLPATPDFRLQWIALIIRHVSRVFTGETLVERLPLSLINLSQALSRAFVLSVSLRMVSRDG
jgi:hypothetical protein